MNPSTGWWKPGVFALNSPITYAWNSGIGGTSTDSIPQFTYPAGTYQVSCKISDVNSCTQTDSVSIVAHPPFSVDLGPDTSVCGMSSLVLGGTLPTGGYAYLWSNTATSQTITVGAGTYTVTVTDTNLCTAIDTILVATGGAQTPFLGQDTLICPGDSLELDAGAGWASYLWSSMDTTQTISIDSAGTYYVDVVDSMNCMAVDSFVLAIDSIFTVDLGIDTIIVCSDSTILLDAGNFGPSKTYLWSTGATTQTISVTQPNTYLVTVTSSAMCEESDSVKFLNYLKNSFSLPGDTILCNGDTLDLDVSLAGLGFLWSTGATTPTLMVNMMGIFWVDVLDSNACWTRDSIAINYTAPPQVALSGLNSAYCGNDPVISLVGTPTGGTFYGPGVAGASFDPGQIIAPDTVLLIYGYAPANQCEGRDSLSVIIRPVPAVSLAGLGGSYCVADSIATLSGIPAGGTFSGPGIVAASFDPAQAGQGVHSIAYTFTDGQGCTGTTLANTQVFALPQVSISGLAAAYCETADPIMLNGVPTGGTFSGPGVVGAVFDPVIAGASAGHNIAYTYTDGNGCQGVAAITVAINVATGTADAGADQEIWLGNQTELAAVLPALGTGAWTIVQGTGELAGATDPHSTISGLQDGLTILEWTLTNGVCNTAGQMRIKKHPFEEKRGFSPNGDGLNDFFVIEGLERYPKSKMIIRSRWGETIWQAPNYANDWNGVNHAGEPFPDDTYFFELQVSNGTHYKGFVVLRR
ncbi:MAG TPA: gliding motility-associated C-terminal domain-containing protein [Bacteroidetes bacterium]|nr:gliding motility-associated C-terminal domain-containing protein [Bacteroidota bacterium]